MTTQNWNKYSNCPDSGCRIPPIAVISIAPIPMAPNATAPAPIAPNSVFNLEETTNAFCTSGPNFVILAWTGEGNKKKEYQKVRSPIKLTCHWIVDSNSVYNFAIEKWRILDIPLNYPRGSWKDMIIWTDGGQDVWCFAIYNLKKT